MSIQESMSRSDQERDLTGGRGYEPTQHEGRERAIVSVSAPLRPMPESGMGSRLVIGQGSGLDALDPFPAMMHDDVPPHVMFPMHQHRGVEIVTYALGGALHHEDSLGNEATVVAGGAERNLFGRGYYHSEAPVGGEHYLGFQLFIVLSPEDRDREPTFQLLAPDEVPEVRQNGAHVRVVAGEYAGARSPLDLRNPTQYLDVRLEPGAEVVLPVPAEFNGIVYVLDGQGRFGTPAVEAGPNQRLMLGGGEALRAAAASGGDPLRFVLVSGKPVDGGA
ncbi:MAG TPA: pirin family protein [Chloroflexota bacterium]|nr:pirin family protein [Chloroflexota bacterium]